MAPEVARRAIEPYFSTKGDRDGTRARARERPGARPRAPAAICGSTHGSAAGTTISIYLPALDACGRAAGATRPLAALTSRPTAAAVAEEVAQQLARLVGEHAGADLGAMVESLLAEHVEDRAAAPAFGSGAAKTTRGTRARTIAPAHIAHGSSVT